MGKPSYSRISRGRVERKANWTFAEIQPEAETVDNDPTGASPTLGYYDRKAKQSNESLIIKWGLVLILLALLAKVLIGR